MNTCPHDIDRNHACSLCAGAPVARLQPGPELRGKVGTALCEVGPIPTFGHAGTAGKGVVAQAAEFTVIDFYAEAA